MEDRLAKFVGKMVGKIKNIPHAKLLLRCTAKRDSGCEERFFVAAAGNAAAGAVPLRLFFIEAHRIDDGGADGAIRAPGQIALQISRVPAFRPNRSTGMGQPHACGMMSHCTAWDIPALLLEKMPTPSSVTFDAVRTVLLGSDRFRIDRDAPLVGSDTVQLHGDAPGPSGGGTGSRDDGDWEDGLVPKLPNRAGAKPRQQRQSPSQPGDGTPSASAAIATAMSTEGTAFGEALDLTVDDVSGAIGEDARAQGL